MTTTPEATYCQKDGTFISVRPFCSPPRVSAPISEPSGFADAAEQTGAADHRRADRLQFEAAAADRLGRTDAGDQHEAGDARKHARHRIDGDLDPLDVDAGELGRLLVAADGDDLLAERGEAHQQKGDGGDRQRQDHRRRNVEDAAGEDGAELRRQAVDRLAVGVDQRGAAKDAERARASR